MKRRPVLLYVLSVLVCTSCGVQAQGDNDVKIKVALPVQRQVADFVECTGRTHAAVSVTIMPRVTGFIDEIPFTEGDMVKKGDVLFKIDPRPYEAQYKAAQAKVAAGRASLRYAEVTNARFKQLAATKPGSVSERELDQYQALQEQAKANLELAEANLLSAQLNLEFTTVRGAIAGRVGRYQAALGDLVNQDASKLSTVVSLDPMYVSFDVDQSKFLHMKRIIEAGKIAQVKVSMALRDGVPYPHEGTMNLADSRVDPKDGEVEMRAVFANPRPAKGSEPLVPGLFVRLKITFGPPRSALLISDSLVLDQRFWGLERVIVLNGKKLIARSVKIGQVQPDGLRVIESGLSKDDRVVIVASTELRFFSEVEPDQVEQVLMPSLPNGKEPR